MSSRLARAALILLLASAAGIWACGDSGSGPPGEPPTPRPTTIALISGGSQTATVGQALASDVVVRVDDQNGTPMAGRTVIFAVAQGGGSVDPASGTSDASGQAATSWTVGTIAGAQQLRVSVTGASGLEASIGATATADVADSVAVVHGNDQIGIVGEALFDSIVVKVFDQYGNGVPGHSATFSVGSGGTGSVNPTNATTAASGEAWTRWTLGPEIAIQNVDVDAGGLKNDPLTFSAEGTNLRITGVAPDPLVEGQTATITGTGFSPTPADNTVLIESIAATVTASDAGSITFTVPTFDCRPARDVSVQAQVAGSNSIPQTRALQPDEPILSLAVGEQRILQHPADFCFQLAASGTAAEYLIGVQSAGETVSRLTPVTLTGVKDPAAPAPPALAPPALHELGGVNPLAIGPRTERWQRHREAEMRLRAAERRLMPAPRRGRRAMAAQGPSLVPPDAQVGDTVSISYPEISNPALGGWCDDFTTITTVVKKNGAKGIWLEDTANPAGGFSDTDYQFLSDQLDDSVYPTDTLYFGQPTDMDGNGKIVVVVTKQVNEEAGTLGFVVSTDLDTVASCASSNEGELYYAKAPESSYPSNVAITDAPFLIAHELTHVIQFGVRATSTTALDFLSRWETEGQATLGEEVVGFAIEGRSPGQDYGLDVAFDLSNVRPVDWYVNGFADLGLYFGWDPFEPPDGNGRVAAAPHECSWLAREDEGNDGACIPIREVYGTPKTLLRWLSDHYGSSFPGGEAELQRRIVAGDFAGYANIENVLGVPMAELLAKWAPMLYLDGRLTPVDPKLALPSWDLFDVYWGTDLGRRLKTGLRLVPKSAAFGDFSKSFSVRDASSYYLLVSGASRPSVAIKARDGAGATLPLHMQYWIVRTQ